MNSDLTTAPDIRPRDTKVGIIIDTRSDIAAPTGRDIEFGALHGRPRTNGYTPVDELFIEIRSGVVVGIMGDDCDSAADSFVGDVTINIYGGNITLGDPQIRVLRSTLYGDLSINVGQRYGVATNVGWIQAEFSTPGADVYGNYTFRMTGGKVNRYYGASNATGTILNEITGGTLGRFDGSRVAQSGTLKNVMKGNATVTGDYYGRCGSVSSQKVINEIGGNAKINGKFVALENGTCGTVENRLSGGTIGDLYYGAGIGATVGNVLNDVIGTVTFKKTFVGGSLRGVVTGDVVNNISGGFFSLYYGGSLGEVKESTTKTTETVTDSLGTDYTQVTKVTTNAVVSSADIEGTIYNNLFGGSFSDTVYGGSKIGNVDKIVNQVKNVTFSASFFGGYGGLYTDSVKVDRAQYNDDGSFKMSDNGSQVVTKSETLSSERFVVSEIGSIENTVEIPTSNQVKSFYLGGYYARVGSVSNVVKSGSFHGNFAGGGYAGELASVTNTVNGGTFMGADGNHFCYYGALYAGSMTGSVTNVIHGGTFNRYAIGGGSSGAIVSTSEFAIKNVIDGGMFSNFWGGSAGSSATVSGHILNEIRGGIFDYYVNDGKYYYAAFSGGCRNAQHVSGDVVNTVYGGTFYHNFYPGSLPGSADYGYANPGTITTRFVGGEIYATVHTSSWHGTYSKSDIILDPDFESEYNSTDLRIFGTFGLESKAVTENGLEKTTTVVLDSAQNNPVFVTSSCRIFADASNDGWICNVGRWEEGAVYLVMPGSVDPKTVFTAWKRGPAG